MVIFICEHVVKTYNYTSALIIYKVNRNFPYLPPFIFHKKYDIVIELIYLFCWRIPKPFTKQFLKKAAIQAALCIHRWEMKNVQPLLLFFGWRLCSVCMFVWNKWYSTAHSIFKTCVQRKKDHFGLLLNTSRGSKRLYKGYKTNCSRL